MISLETLYFLTLLFVLILELLFATTLFFVKRKLDRERQSYSGLFEATRSHLSEIVVEASQQSRTTVQHTLDTHDRILRELDQFSTALQRKSELLVQNMSTWEKNTIEEQTKTYGESLARESQNSILTLRASVSEHIEQLDGEIVKTIQDTQHQLKTSLSQAFTATEQQLAVYKQQRMSELAAKTEQVVHKVAGEILGKNMSSQEHHDVTKMLLEKAMQEGELRP